MDNLEDPSNVIDNEASTSSNETPSSKKRKLSNDQYQNELKSMKEQFDDQKDIIYSQTCELFEGRRVLKNVKNELQRMTKNEEELQAKIVAFEEQKKMAEADLVILKADMNDQLAGLKKENEEKDEKIKELEERLSAAREHLKLDPDNFKGGLENRIKELEAQLLHSKTNTEIYFRTKMTEMHQKNNNQTKILQAENDRLNAIIKEQDQKSKETEQKLAAEVSTVTELQLELEKIQTCYKADLQKTSPNQGTYYQNQIKELNDKITVAKDSYAKLYSQNEELKQKELNTRADIVNREKQIQDLQNMLAERAQVAESIIDLDELCDDSGFRYDRLLNQNNITVIKVKNVLFTPRELTLCSERGTRNVRLTLLDFIQNICGFQVNGECDLSRLRDLNSLPIINSFNLKSLNFGNTTVEYEKFLKLVSSHKITTFIGGSIKRENDAILAIDEILKELPNVESFELKSCELSENDCEKLVQLPTFSKLRRFKLHITKSPSDLISFAEFIKKHKNAIFTFSDHHLLQNKDRNAFPEKVKKLREILPPKCKVFCDKKTFRLAS